MPHLTVQIPWFETMNRFGLVSLVGFWPWASSWSGADGNDGNDGNRNVDQKVNPRWASVFVGYRMMEQTHGACLFSILLTVTIHRLEQVGIRDMTFCCQCAPKYICCRLIEAPRAHFISEIKPPACKLSHACTRCFTVPQFLWSSSSVQKHCLVRKVWTGEVYFLFKKWAWQFLVMSTRGWEGLEWQELSLRARFDQFPSAIAVSPVLCRFLLRVGVAWLVMTWHRWRLSPNCWLASLLSGASRLLRRYLPPFTQGIEPKRRLHLGKMGR